MGVRVNWMVAVLMLAAGPLTAEDQIVWQTDIAKAVKQAKAEHKLVLVHFYGDMCPPCKVVEKKVFPQPEVVQAVMRNYVPVKINVEKDEKIAAKYAIQQIPQDLFLAGGTGQVLNRVITKDSASEYATMLDNYAIQTGSGTGREAAFRERQSKYDSKQQNNEEQPPPPEQQMVQNEYVGARGNTTANRYSPRATAGPAQPQGEPEAPAYGAGAGSPPVSKQAQAGPYGQEQVGPYAPPPQQQNARAASSPEMVKGYGPQGNTAPPAAQSMQRATFQDPGDITARQPIRTQMIPVKDAPPLGLQGFCPVTIRDGGKWTRGDKRYGAIHRGRTYLFVSAEQQHRFLADPDQFSPILSGADPVIFLEQGKLVEGSRNFGVSLPIGGRTQMFFFASQENLDKFAKNSHDYVTAAHQAMLRSETQPLR